MKDDKRLKALADINKHCNPYSILVINKQGKLIKLKTPFRVQCISQVGIFHIGEILTVIAVKVTKDLIMVYLINTKYYRYYHFIIRDTFKQ